MKNIKLLCIGDSLTFGYEVPEEKRWTNLLSNELNIDVLNEGINGDTTSGILNRLLPKFREFKPSHVFILGGTNDLWFGLKNEFILSQIYAMCKQALHYNIIPIVGIPTPCFNTEEYNLIGENYTSRIKIFQDDLVKFCLLKEIEFINLNEDILQEYFMDDGIHFNHDGHVFVMNKLKEILQKILNSI